MTNNKKSKKGKWTRRAFIATGGLAGVGLVVGIGGNIYVNKKIKEYSGEGFGDGASLNAWIRIAPDNTISMAVPRAEMGQGVYTSMPMIMAEELEVDMNSIKVIHPQPESPYANTFFLANKPRDIFTGYNFMEKVSMFLPVIGTGGSTSIRDQYDNLRMMGATAREMLITAAANKWGVDKKDCFAESAFVINRTNQERLSYGSLAMEAAKIEIEGFPKLKERKEFKKIGKSLQRLDIPEKVTGEAEYGLDVRLENMLYAVIRHATYFDGKINSVKNKSTIEAMPGVKKIVMLPEGIGAVVVADNTWRAKNAAVAMEFDETGNNTLSSKEIEKMMDETIANDMIASPMKTGDAAGVLDKSEKVIEAKYRVPYLAHACMEPINCTVLVKDGKAEAWVGHQGSSLVQNGVNEATGIDKSNIKVNMTYLGGGFGRRAELDMVKTSSHIAKEMEGTPIQLVYTREECMRHEMYRPAVASNFRATVNAKGEIDAWENKMALQSVGYSSIMRIMPAMAESPAKDPSSSEGAGNLPYDMNNATVSFGQLELPIQVGNWRSVGSSQNAFFTESFMDECAHAAGIDPYEFRKTKLNKHPRHLAVLNKVAEMSNWSTPIGEGKFRGIALHESFASIVAQVAEVTKVGEKEFKVDKVYCVIDCGQAINPNTIEAQMQSGIVYGLTAALYGEITISEGEVEQYNFPQYEIVRMKVSPTVEVHIMDIDAYPGGVGEPSTPPIAPALTNAIFAATGDRVRSLPLMKHGYTFV